MPSFDLNWTSQPLHATCQGKSDGAWNSRSEANARLNAWATSQRPARHKEGKLAYIKLNIQMPCPPRGTVPANSGRTSEIFHFVPSGPNFGIGCDRPAMSGDFMASGGFSVNDQSALMTKLLTRYSAVGLLELAVPVRFRRQAIFGPWSLVGISEFSSQRFTSVVGICICLAISLCKSPFSKRAT
jgi:hypothetical protein